MPWHYHPLLRAIEEVMETKTMEKTLDSGGVTVIKADESASKRTKVVPKVQIVYLGTTTIPS